MNASLTFQWYTTIHAHALDMGTLQAGSYTNPKCLLLHVNTLRGMLICTFVKCQQPLQKKIYR